MARGHTHKMTGITLALLFALGLMPHAAHRALPALHKYADSMASAAACAAEQGKFWALHDAFFAGQPRTVDKVRATALAVGLAPEAYDRCLGGGGTSIPKADVNDGIRLGVEGTPTLFVGYGVDGGGTIRIVDRLRGAAGYDVVSRMLSSVLAGKPSTATAIRVP